MNASSVGSDEGASAVEYALIAVAIAAVIVAVVFVLGGFTKGGFQDACTNLETVGATNSGTSGNDCNS